MIFNYVLKPASNAARSIAVCFVISLLLFAGCQARSRQEETNHAVRGANSEQMPQTDEAQSGTAHTVTPQSNSQTYVGDWPLYRGDSLSSGVARSGLPENLEVLWEFSVDQGAFEGTPGIVGDAEINVYIADLDGKVYALNLETGEKKWEFQSEIGFVTAPAVKDGRIYLGNIDGVFYCLDSAGKQVWRFQADAEINSSANFYKDRVLFGSQDARLYALNIETGQKTWVYESPDQIRCSATVADNRGFVAGCDGFLHIIDLENGTEIGRVEILSPTGVTPAVLDNSLFVGIEQGIFMGIDWLKAELLWKFEDPNGAGSIRGSPAVVDQHVVFGARNRNVYSLDPRTGKSNWTTTLKSPVESSPVIVGPRVFVASTDGRLYGLELATGKIVWEKQFDGGFIGSPAVAFGRLVIASDRGVVYCLGERNPGQTR